MATPQASSSASASTRASSAWRRSLASSSAMLLLLALPDRPRVVRRREARRATQELRDALDERASQRARRCATAQAEAATRSTARYARKAPELAGYLEQMAQQAEARGHRLRRSARRARSASTTSSGAPTIHLKKAGLLDISQVHRERSSSRARPIAVTRLNLRKRTGEPDSYDVELGVSAYDRVEKPQSRTRTAARPRRRRRSREPKWKERLRKYGTWVGYPLFYLFAFVFFLSLVFPYDKLRERIVYTFNAQQRSGTAQQELQIDEVGW